MQQILIITAIALVAIIATQPLMKWYTGSNSLETQLKIQNQLMIMNMTGQKWEDLPKYKQEAFLEITKSKKLDDESRDLEAVKEKTINTNS